VSLGVVSQRPAEIDPTVLSQCSTIFAMRMPNEVDKAIVRNALSEYSASLVNLLPAIADREAIAFGEAVPTPMRMTFGESRFKIDHGERPQNIPIGGMTGLQRIVNRLRGDSPD
jgi:DNA helicase HerA-like ATPase